MTVHFRALVGAAAGFACNSAWSHHPMDGQMPTSLASGLLSGLGHPVIEPAHLLFLAGAAVVAGTSRVPLRRALALLAAYVLASTGATALAVSIEPTIVQLALGASLAALVPWIWWQRAPARSGAWALAAASGLVHGTAFAETVIGAEVTPLLAYLAGLAVIQSLLLMSVCYATRSAHARRPQAVSTGSRAFAGGLLVAGVGVALGSV